MLDETTTNISLAQPFYLAYMNVDTHTPFQGFDVESNYKKYGTENEYGTVLKSADDRMINQVVSLIKSVNNNTIFIVIGDHGARESKIFNKTDKLSPSIAFDSQCNNQFGNDLMFTTSAVITYFGDD